MLSSLPPQGLALALPSAGLPFPASSLDRCLIFQGSAQLYFVGMLSLTPKAKAAPPPPPQASVTPSRFLLFCSFRALFPARKLHDSFACRFSSLRSTPRDRRASRSVTAVSLGHRVVPGTESRTQPLYWSVARLHFVLSSNHGDSSSSHNSCSDNSNR